MKKTLVTITAIILLTALPLSSPGTGIPVLDVSNLTESIRHGLEQIRQFTTQVSQLETEINSYKTLVLQNTGIAAAAQIWQDAQRTYGQVMSAVTGLQNYATQATDINYWISTATAAGAAQYNQSAGYWSTAQKTANTQLVQTIQKQQAQLTADAATLQRLQTQGGSTVGMKQSLDVANQMSSLMASQLMAIRTLMMSEQQAVAAKNGASANNQAIQQAGSQKFFQATITTESANGWHPW